MYDWGWIWGATGMLLAVPTVAGAKASAIIITTTTTTTTTSVITIIINAPRGADRGWHQGSRSRVGISGGSKNMK